MTSILNLGSKIPISEIDGDIATTEDLSNKADKNLANTTPNELFKNYFAPDYTKSIDIGNNYTCVSNGYVYIWTFIIQHGEQFSIYINNVCVMYVQKPGDSVRYGGFIWRVKKGDVVSYTDTAPFLKFCPLMEEDN